MVVLATTRIVVLSGWGRPSLQGGGCGLLVSVIADCLIVSTGVSNVSGARVIDQGAPHAGISVSIDNRVNDSR